ncbi:hypothetical protein QBC32DRAFT_239977 [Pseudoneurospora amorphoporcata]|uniref:SH3 domain-containing protein n=1 Tax=Pseudoneurospora amorphoporcata TaxID=241081 RepID=A0AAN6SEC4_9PEZI|nr:hypothetical protein QBC32DRAFT_239977 [Pseudoneurospora amorphoporcata]
MQSVQRKFTKLRSKGPGNNAAVSVLLKEYEDADQLLARLLENSRAWRDAWASLVHHQLQFLVELEGLYDPIVGASDGHGRESVPTPRLQLERTYRLKQAYGELKSELAEEIGTIEDRVIRPAVEARDCIAPIRKTIKKRENKRLDYERAQDKVSKLHKKHTRTPKEEASLAKAEVEMAQAGDEFAIADEHLQSTLPPIIQASFSLVPPLQAALILIQNRLLGLYYTTAHGYCMESGFPSPPPPMSEVVAAWEAAFIPARDDFESVSIVARGKAAHSPMALQVPDGPGRRLSAMIPGRNDMRRVTSPMPSSSSVSINSGSGYQGRNNLRIPSAGGYPSRPHSPAASDRSSYASSPPASSYSGYSGNQSQKRLEYLTPTDFTQASSLARSPADRTTLENNRPFPRSPSTPSMSINRAHSPQAIQSAGNSNGNGNGNANGNDYFALAVAKKRPPPPPPPKRIASQQQLAEYVVAQYTFAGQGAGDLAFNEGDRIKIVKKTNTDQDWWVGELNGKRGNFPANYCKPA